MTRKIDYETPYKVALEHNISEVRAAVLSGDVGMHTKLVNYSKKYGIPIKFLEHKVLNDNVFANRFAKEPSRQTLHQKVAAAFIESINCVEDFRQLPAGGQNAKFICSDGVVREGENDGMAKSIDFFWKFDGNNYYAAHKHTTDEGGSQDNQFNDLQLFLKYAAESKKANTYFLAIGDGEYYQRKYKSGNKEYRTRIDYMNAQYGTDFSAAITANDLEDFLIEHSSYKIISE